jgi:hypothetical protein
MRTPDNIIDHTIESQLLRLVCCHDVMAFDLYIISSERILYIAEDVNMENKFMQTHNTIFDGNINFTIKIAS